MREENSGTNNVENSGSGGIGAEKSVRGGGSRFAPLEGVAGRLGQITVKQQRAIALILAGCAVTAVARSLGVSRVTEHRWLKDETFRAAMNSWRHDMARAARARVTALSVAATKVVYEAL